MKKLFSIIFLMLGCVSLFAMQQATTGQRQTAYESMQQQISEIKEQLQIDTKYYDYLPTYAANCYFSVEALAWTATNNAWPFALKYALIGEFSDVYWTNRKFDYDPGLRMGFGVKTCYDWDIFVQWTYFNSKHSDSLTDESGLISEYVYDRFTHIHSTWRLKYNMIDLEIGRAFHGARTLAIKPFIGLRGGWLRQKGHNKADGVYGIPDLYGVPSDVVGKEKTWLVGPRTGVNIDYFFGNTGLSLYGNLAAALVYAEAKSIVESWNTEFATGVFEITDRYASKFDDLKATLQVAFGLSWGDFVDEQDIGLRVRAGWEANYWWNQYDQYLFFQPEGPSYRPNEPLILQGATINARLDF